MLEHHLIYDVLRTIHLLSIVVWIGGMYFVHFFLRPALAPLEPAQRLTLMHGTLGRFFAAVLVASVATIGSGIWMLGRTAKTVSQTGGNFAMPWSWSAMVGLGLLMLLIFFYIRFVLFRSFDDAIQQRTWPAAAAQLGRIRHWVTVNMTIGTTIIITQSLFG